MSKGLQTVLTVFAYTIIIVGTMILSGQIFDRKTLYDRFIVRPEGSILFSTDMERTVRFYTEVLDFVPIMSHETTVPQVVGFLAPGDQRILLNLIPPAGGKQLQSEPQTQLGNSALVFRVKNGFPAFHESIVQRSGVQTHPLTQERYLNDVLGLPSGHVSSVASLPWGNEFVVKDFDNNLLIFYHPKFLSLIRPQRGG